MRAALAAIGLLAAACGQQAPQESRLPVLTCHENEVAVWQDYPISYRCVPEGAHSEHTGSESGA